MSWAELALGMWLISGLVPDRRTATAGATYHAIQRMDGGKMFLLGAMALAISQLARRSPILPRWLAPLGALLAAALVASGLGCLLLTPGLASAVYVSGVLLLIFVSATGIALRSRYVGAISPPAPVRDGPLALLRRRRPSSRLQIRGLPTSSRMRCPP